MPVEFKYFVQSDFDTHERWIFATCEELLDAKLEKVIYEQTSAPLGEGENEIIAYVRSSKPAPNITYDKVYKLKEKLQERLGYLSFQVNSVCPRCKKHRFTHYGYIGGDDGTFPSMDVCDSCSSKELNKKKCQETVECPECGKKFVVKDHGEGYTMRASLDVRSDTEPYKHTTIASVEDNAGSYFDAVRFCSKKCLQLRLDKFIKELSAICNNL